MKLVSVMGDSISTYVGYNPPEYSVFYGESNCERNGINSVEDTWWDIVIKSMNATLCMNDSYSGSRVSGDLFPSAKSDVRTSNLHRDNLKPDIILVYIGFNDFGSGIPIVRDTTVYTRDSFYESYLEMLEKIKNNYPESRIYAATLLRGYLRGKLDWSFPNKWGGVPFDEYNAAIKIAARTAKVEIADLASLNRKYETLDGTHPTARGHLEIATAWLRCLQE